MSLLSAENCFKKGLLALVDENYEDAAALFRQAIDVQRERKVHRPEWRYLSYYGLSLAKSHRPTPEAVRACETAVRAETYNPELYLNLGRVYVMAGKVTRGLEVFERGLKVAPKHVALRKEMTRLDRRSRPPIPLLKRSNPLNRWMGMARGAVATRAIR
jgi:tetratricopeptide (TPR) repeat protein